MASAGSTSGKSSHDILGYRDVQLGNAGILINEYTVEELPIGLRQMILGMTQYDRTIPDDSPTVRPLTCVARNTAITQTGSHDMICRRP